MRTVRRQIGIYGIGMLLAAPLWLLVKTPLLPLVWCVGVSWGFLLAWLELKRFDTAYRRSLAEAVFNMPKDASNKEQNEFADLFMQKLNAGMPLMKMNRWLGYMQGRRIERGVMSIDDERDRTRPLFKHLDVGRFGIWS